MVFMEGDGGSGVDWGNDCDMQSENKEGTYVCGRVYPKEYCFNEETGRNDEVDNLDVDSMVELDLKGVPMTIGHPPLDKTFKDSPEIKCGHVVSTFIKDGDLWAVLEMSGGSGKEYDDLQNRIRNGEEVGLSLGLVYKDKVDRNGRIVWKKYTGDHVALVENPRRKGCHVYKFQATENVPTNMSPHQIASLFERIRSVPRRRTFTINAGDGSGVWEQTNQLETCNLGNIDADLKVSESNLVQEVDFGRALERYVNGDKSDNFRLGWGDVDRHDESQNNSGPIYKIGSHIVHRENEDTGDSENMSVPDLSAFTPNTSTLPPVTNPNEQQLNFPNQQQQQNANSQNQQQQQQQQQQSASSKKTLPQSGTDFSGLNFGSGSGSGSQNQNADDQQVRGNERDNAREQKNDQQMIQRKENADGGDQEKQTRDRRTSGESGPMKRKHGIAFGMNDEEMRQHYDKLSPEKKDAAAMQAISYAKQERENRERLEAQMAELMEEKKAREKEEIAETHKSLLGVFNRFIEEHKDGGNLEPEKEQQIRDAFGLAKSIVESCEPKKGREFMRCIQKVRDLSSGTGLSQRTMVNVASHDQGYAQMKMNEQRYGSRTNDGPPSMKKMRIGDSSDMSVANDPNYLALMRGVRGTGSTQMSANPTRQEKAHLDFISGFLPSANDQKREGVDLSSCSDPVTQESTKQLFGSVRSYNFVTGKGREQLEQRSGVSRGGFASGNAEVELIDPYSV